jgi:hypothetical protein
MGCTAEGRVGAAGVVGAAAAFRSVRFRRDALLHYPEERPSWERVKRGEPGARAQTGRRGA